jgi:predicted glutamine amidotransferase
MCIIVAKPYGKKFPSFEAVNNCCTNNPDGFAFSVAQKGKKMKTFKSMDKAEFMKEYTAMVMKTPADKSTMVLHARIATHGSKNVDNCHGFLNDTGTLSFFHNGILSIKAREDLTDSETFYRDIFLPIFNMHGLEAAKKAVHAVIGTSKFAFVDANAGLLLFGDYNTHEDCFYSNFTFQKYEPVVYNYGSYGYYGSGSQKSWDEYDDYDWEKNPKTGKWESPSWKFDDVTKRYYRPSLKQLS